MLMLLAVWPAHAPSAMPAWWALWPMGVWG